MPFPFDISLIIDSLPLLGIGALVTIEITAVAVALGTLIGLFVGIAELSRYWYFRIPSKIYVDFIRGTSAVGANLYYLLCSSDYFGGKG